MALVNGTNCGFVTVRPTDDPTGSDTQTCDNFAIGFKVVAPTGATNINEVGWWSNVATEAADTDVGIYSHDAANDRPLTLLGSATFAKGTTAGWKYGAINVDVVAGTTYWIAFQLDDTTTASRLDYTADATQKIDYKSTQTSLPASWGTSSGTFAWLPAIYAVYTTGGVTYSGSVSIITN